MENVGYRCRRCSTFGATSRVCKNCGSFDTYGTTEAASYEYLEDIDRLLAELGVEPISEREKQPV